MPPSSGRDQPDARQGSKPPVLLHAASIAIVGASPDDNKLGGKPVRFLKDYGYRGRVFPVNPKYEDIRGFPCYPALSASGDDIDVVVCAVPAEQVLAVVRECIGKRVKQLVVFSSGFAEIGEAGAERQRALKDAIRDAPLRVIGPNTLGVANIAERASRSWLSRPAARRAAARRRCRTRRRSPARTRYATLHSARPVSCAWTMKSRCSTC